MACRGHHKFPSPHPAMTEILKRSKPLTVNPLKVSQPVGATLAFLGLGKAISMLHGSQGCTAFAKVFFVGAFPKSDRAKI